MSLVVSVPPPFKNRVLFDSIRLDPSAMKLKFTEDFLGKAEHNPLPDDSNSVMINRKKLLATFLQVTTDIDTLSSQWNLCVLPLRAHYSNQKVLPEEELANLLLKMKGILTQQLELYRSSPQFNRRVIRDMMELREQNLRDSKERASAQVSELDISILGPSIGAMVKKDVERMLNGEQEQDEESDLKNTRLLSPDKVANLERYLARSLEVKKATELMFSEISDFFVGDLKKEMRTHWLLNYNKLTTGKCAALSEHNYKEWAEISQSLKIVTGIQTFHMFSTWEGENAESERQGDKQSAVAASSSATFETSLQIPPAINKLEIVNPRTQYNQEQLAYSALCIRIIEENKLPSELTSFQVKWAEFYYDTCVEEIIPVLLAHKRAEKSKASSSLRGGSKSSSTSMTGSCLDFHSSATTGQRNTQAVSQKETVPPIKSIGKLDSLDSTVSDETDIEDSDDDNEMIVQKENPLTTTTTSSSINSINPKDTLTRIFNGIPLFQVRIAMIKYVARELAQRRKSEELKTESGSSTSPAPASQSPSQSTGTASSKNEDEYDEDCYFESSGNPKKIIKREAKRTAGENGAGKGETTMTSEQFHHLCAALEPVGVLSARELVIPYNTAILEKMTSSRKSKNSFVCDKLYGSLKEKMK